MPDGNGRRAAGGAAARANHATLRHRIAGSAAYCAVSLRQAALFPNSMTAALDAAHSQGSHATALFGFALQLIATGIGSLALIIPHQHLTPVALLLVGLTVGALLLGARRAPRRGQV